jgi:hypothetical protein
VPPESASAIEETLKIAADIKIARIVMGFVLPASPAGRPPRG